MKQGYFTATYWLSLTHSEHQKPYNGKEGSNTKQGSQQTVPCCGNSASVSVRLHGFEWDMGSNPIWSHFSIFPTDSAYSFMTFVHSKSHFLNQTELLHKVICL